MRSVFVPSHLWDVTYRPILQQWTHTVAEMLAAVVKDGARVVRSCPSCDVWEELTPVQLAKLVEVKNPLYSLVNRRPPCPSCGRRMNIHTTPGSSGPFAWLHSDWPEDVNPIHAAWKREHNRRRKLGPPDER